MQTPGPVSAHRSPVRAGPATTVFEMTSPSQVFHEPGQGVGKTAPLPCAALPGGLGGGLVGELAASIIVFLPQAQGTDAAYCTHGHTLFLTPREVATAFKETHQPWKTFPYNAGWSSRLYPKVSAPAYKGRSA